MKRRGAAAMSPKQGGQRKRRKGAKEDQSESPPDSEHEDVRDDQHGKSEGACPPSSRRRRWQPPAAEVNGQSDDDEGEGEGEEEDGDEDGDGDEAAGQAHLAGPIPDINDAANMLSQLTGLPAEEALTALRESQEAVERLKASGTAGPALLQAWLEEAQVWIACNREVQGEIDDVRLAMQESLQEYEAVKAADDVPLAQRPPDFLRDRFLGGGAGSGSGSAQRSVLIKRLADFVCHRALFATATTSNNGSADRKANLVKLADLESKCRRWYPNKGTGRFWERLAEECMAAALQAAPAAPSLKHDGWVGCSDGPDGCTTCAAALGRSTSTAAGDSEAGPSTSAARPAAVHAAAAAATAPRVALKPEAAAAVVSAVGSFAVRKAPEVEHEVCKMPTVSGQVPDVFALLDDVPGQEGDSDADEVVVLTPGAAGGAARGREQVEVQ